MLHHEMLLMENLYLTFYCFRAYTAVEMLLVTNCFTELQPELVTISHPHTLSCHFVRYTSHVSALFRYTMKDCCSV